VQCKKKHVSVCPEFTATGVCPRGRGCPLRHVAKKHRPTILATTHAKTEDITAGYGCIRSS